MKIEIICTIGPACQSLANLKKIIKAGMTIARLNFSHGTYSEYQQIIQDLRQASLETGKPIKILQDLSGPKIRTQNKIPLSLKAEEELILGKDLKISHPEILNNLKLHDRILIDDGTITLQLIDNKRKLVKVLNHCTIKPHKGVNFPDTSLTIPTITKKDRQDLKFGLQNNIDLLAQSFVQSAAEIHELRELSNNRLPIIAKIERPQALENIDEIAKASDMLMVARGDLGVELPIEKLLIYQNQILQSGKANNTPVIIATQMLSSMLVHKTPTRAEVIDISNSILSGAEGLLLSNETSVGPFFAEATLVLQNIIQELTKP